MQNLPGYLIRFFKRFTTASYTSAVATTPLSSMYLHRDQFGFQKLVVVATKGGKVVAMDSANGGVVWARNLGVTNENGTELVVEGMWNVRDHGEVGEPMLAVLATRTRGEVSRFRGLNKQGRRRLMVADGIHGRIPCECVYGRGLGGERRGDGTADRDAYFRRKTQDGVLGAV
jgi:hypothetical protein